MAGSERGSDRDGVRRVLDDDVFSMDGDTVNEEHEWVSEEGSRSPRRCEQRSWQAGAVARPLVRAKPASCLKLDAALRDMANRTC